MVTEEEVRLVWIVRCHSFSEQCRKNGNDDDAQTELDARPKLSDLHPKTVFGYMEFCRCCTVLVSHAALGLRPYSRVYYAVENVHDKV